MHEPLKDLIFVTELKFTAYGVNILTLYTLYLVAWKVTLP